MGLEFNCAMTQDVLGFFYLRKDCLSADVGKKFNHKMGI